MKDTTHLQIATQIIQLLTAILEIMGLCFALYYLIKSMLSAEKEN